MGCTQETCYSFHGFLEKTTNVSKRENYEQILDSCASNHIFGNDSIFTFVSPPKFPHLITLVNGSTIASKKFVEARNHSFKHLGSKMCYNFGFKYDQTLSIFMSFNEIKNKNDNAIEYFSSDFSSFLTTLINRLPSSSFENKVFYSCLRKGYQFYSPDTRRCYMSAWHKGIIKYYMESHLLHVFNHQLFVQQFQMMKILVGQLLFRKVFDVPKILILSIYNFSCYHRLSPSYFDIVSSLSYTFSLEAKITIHLFFFMAAICHWPFHQLFFSRTSFGKCVYLLVYVDDIDLVGDAAAKISRLNRHLLSHFHTESIVISQRMCALDILEEIGLADCRHIDRPMDPNQKLMAEQGESFSDPKRYRRLVGKSQFMHAPHIDHWNAMICILRYIKKRLRSRHCCKDTTTGYCVFI
uniref:Reverse transcriptase Ty1/copia-type domain-containing protein n=1 Tax=Cajanus cajan TaxID=3821 RepID=A0A151T9V9_CAJCA|nr:hypothetical protein KK1_018377 [Cajanus cajan]